MVGDQGERKKCDNTLKVPEGVDSQHVLAPGEFVASPRAMDVVATKKKCGFKDLPGTKFYRELINQFIGIVMDKKNNASVRSVAEKLVEIVNKEKKAVFLKEDEASGGWIVMDYAASVHKVILALKNAEIKARSESSNTKKKKKKRGISPSTIHTQDLPKIKYQKGSPPPICVYRYVYEVKEGSHEIDPYTKEIINLMCNETEPNEAARALDGPRLEMAENESDEQRQIRLQLRQRYIAAMSTGMSPVIFSRKLLKVWGGTILSRKVIVERRSRDGGINGVGKALSDAGVIDKDNENGNSTASFGQTNNSKCEVVSSLSDKEIQSKSEKNNYVTESSGLSDKEVLKTDIKYPANATVDAEGQKRTGAQKNNLPNVGENSQRGNDETNNFKGVADEATVEL